MVEPSTSMDIPGTVRLTAEQFKMQSGEKIQGDSDKINANTYAAIKGLSQILGETFSSNVNEETREAVTHLEKTCQEETILYQPYDVEQILLPDNGNCLAVKAFLEMCKIDYRIEYKSNAEFMAPSCRVPFIKCGKSLLSDLEPIATHFRYLGNYLPKRDASVKDDFKIFMPLISSTFFNAAEYVTWCDRNSYNSVTKHRYGSVHPFPLNLILPAVKRNNVLKRLQALGWSTYDLDKVVVSVDKCCRLISDRLTSSGPYFFGEYWSEVDALIFGHVYAIMSAKRTDSLCPLIKVIENYPILLAHASSIAPFVHMSSECLIPPMQLTSIRSTDESLDFVYSDEEFDEYFIEEDSVYTVNDRNIIHESLFPRLTCQSLVES